MQDNLDDSDFDALKTEGTHWLTLHEVRIPKTNPKQLEVELRYAGESNEAFIAMRNNDAFAELRDKDLEASVDRLYGQTVIINWRNALNKDGTEKAYTTELGEQLLGQLRRVKRTGIVAQILRDSAVPVYYRAPLADAGDLGNE